MKIFFWQLNDKEKLYRALWTGFLALILAYSVFIYFGENLFEKIVIPIVLTVIYIVDLSFRYKKMKKENQM